MAQENFVTHNVLNSDIYHLEVSDDENDEIIREIEKLTDDDLQIIKREIVFI